MTFSISIAMTMHYGSGMSSYARKCQKSLTSFERRQVVLVIWLMPSEDYKLIKLLFSLKWNFVFPSPYFFRSIPSSLTNNEEAYAECFPGRRTGEGSGSLPLLPPWLRANSEVKVPSNPSLVKEVRSTRSKSQVKGIYSYNMFIHS